MSTIYEDAKKTLEKLLPMSVNNLNIGASERELSSLEDFIGDNLPEDFRELYKTYNGQRSGYSGLIFGMKFLSIEEIKYNYDLWLRSLNSSALIYIEDQNSSCLDKVKAVYFDKGWVPFCSDGGGNYLAIDLSPEEKGVIGQVISFGRDEDEKRFLYDSVEYMISDMISKINNEYSVKETSDREGNIVTEFIFKSTGGNSFLDTLKI